MIAPPEAACACLAMSTPPERMHASQSRSPLVKLPKVSSSRTVAAAKFSVLSREGRPLPRTGSAWGGRPRTTTSILRRGFLWLVPFFWAQGLPAQFSLVSWRRVSWSRYVVRRPGSGRTAFQCDGLLAMQASASSASVWVTHTQQSRARYSVRINICYFQSRLRASEHLQ
jgi:hypothetical protein